LKSRVFEFDFVPHTCGTTVFPETWRIFCRFEIHSAFIAVNVRAPLTDAPAPPGAPGRFPHLWRHDVVELFLLGPGERYLELEFGPFCHYWFLQLSGCRQIAGEIEPFAYECRRTKSWETTARLPSPDFEVRACNIACILGTQRAHGSLAKLPGEVPDFHQLAHFLPLFSK